MGRRSGAAVNRRRCRIPRRGRLVIDEEVIEPESVGTSVVHEGNYHIMVPAGQISLGEEGDIVCGLSRGWRGVGTDILSVDTVLRRGTSAAHLKNADYSNARSFSPPQYYSELLREECTHQ